MPNKKYTSIVDGVEQIFNVSDSNYDAFITKHPEAKLMEDFQNGVAEADAAAAPKPVASTAIEQEISELESDLEAFSLDLAKKKSEGKRYSGRAATRQQGILKQKIKAAKNKRYIPAEGPSLENPYSLVMETEETVRGILEANLPINFADSGTPGNEIKYIDPETNKEARIDLRPFTDAGKEETARQLDTLIKKYSSLSQEDYNKMLGETFIDVIEQGEGNIGWRYQFQLDGINNNLTELGYSVRKRDGYASADIYKNGIKIGKAANKNQLRDFFKNTLAEEDYATLKNNSYKAYEKFEQDSKNKKAEVTKKVNETNLAIDYFDSGDWGDAVSKELQDLHGFTEEEAKTVKEYLDRDIDKQKAYNARGAKKPKTADEILAERFSLAGLPDDVRAKIDKNVIDSMFNRRYASFKNDEVNRRMQTINEGLMKASGKQDLLNLASKYKKQDKKAYIAKKEEQAKELIKARDAVSNTLVNKIEQIHKDSPKTKFSVNNIDGQYIFEYEEATGLSADEQKAQKKATAEWYKIQDTFFNAQADFNEDVRRYVEDTKRFEEQEGNVEISPKQLFDLSVKEYGTGALLAKDFGDAVAGMALAIPTLANADWAIEEQKRLNRKNEMFETMLTYDDALEQGRGGLFALRTATQQAPNILLAVATAGAGSSLGLSNMAVQATIGTTFGVTSGTQKFRDTSISRDLSNVAKKQLAANQEAYDQGYIDYNTYSKNTLDLNKTIAMGDLTDNQILGSAFATGLIEGSITAFLGTAPNSIKVIKDFSKGNINISGFIGKNGLQRFGSASFELGKRLGGEVLEEELIYFGDTALSEGLILGRDMDFSQWDDTLVTSIITSGAMSTPGVAYSALMTNAATNKFMESLNGFNNEIADINKALEGVTDQASRDILISRLSDVLKQESNLVGELEVDAIGLGAENQKNLLALNRLERETLIEAGINPNDSKEVVAEKISNYTNELKAEGNSQKAESFQARLNTVRKQKQEIQKNTNLETAENALGVTGKRIKEKFENDKSEKGNEFRSLNKKQQLAYIIKEIRNEQGTDTDVAYKGRAITLSQSAKVSKDILDVTDLNIIEVSNLENAKSELDKLDLTQKQKDEIYASLEEPGSNGFIYENKYITFNKENAASEIADGNILAATAIVHEVAHAIDDRLFDTPEKQKQYADNLHTKLSKDPQLAAFDKQVKQVLSERPDLKNDAGKVWEDTSTEYKDEYTKVVQETLYAFDYDYNLEATRKKEGLFRGINVSTPEGALNYMLNRNADFRAGKVGKRIQSKLKKGPVVAPKKSKQSYSAPKSFDKADRDRMFQKGDDAFNEAASLYGLPLSIDQNGKPNFTKEQWDAVPENTKLVIGFMVGEQYASYVAYRMRTRDQVPGYATKKDEIIDRTSTGTQKGDDGIPFLIKSYNPAGGTKLSTYIYGQIDNRLQGVINKTKGFGEITTEAAPSEPGRKELVSKETAESRIKTEERKVKEGEAPKITLIQDELVIIDDNGKALEISEDFKTEVNRKLKLLWATGKFDLSKPEFRQKFLEEGRALIGPMIKSIMDRGANWNDNNKVGNKAKRANYDSFVDANFKITYTNLTKDQVSARFPFLIQPVLDENGEQVMMSVAQVEAYNAAIDRGEKPGAKKIKNKYANNKLTEKRLYSAEVKKEGTEYLKANDKATNVRNARKTSYADAIADNIIKTETPTVLRGEGLEKEATIKELENQVGIRKFSIGRLTPSQRFSFDNKAQVLFDNLVNLNNFSKPTIRKVLNSIYASDQFPVNIIDGIAEQLSKQLSPVSKAEIKPSKIEFEDILFNIVDQTDQLLGIAQLTGANISIESLFKDKTELRLARGAAFESMQRIVTDLGEEGLQLIMAFGLPTFSASGAIGTYQWNDLTLDLEPGRRANGEPISRGGKDLFSGKKDFMNNLVKGLVLPDGRTIETADTNKITFTDGSFIESKYSKPPTDVQVGMLKDGYESNMEDVKAAQTFVTKFFENIGKGDLSPNTAAILLSVMNDGTGNVLRASAPVWGKASVMPYSKTNAYRFEHAVPARVVLSYLYEYHVSGNKDIDINALWSDYRVTIIPKKEMDDVLTKTGYSKVMEAGYKPGKSNWWGRYYNIFTRGKMPYALVSYDGKEVIGQKFEDYYNSRGAKPIIDINAKEKINEITVEQKAVNNASKFSYGKNPKGISVYDFDDTLAFSKSQVIVKMPADKPMLDIAARRLFGETALKNKPGFLKTFDSLNEEQQAKVLQDVPGAARKITPAEFAKNSEQLTAQGATFDFSEFNKVVKGTPGPLAPRLKKAIEKFGNKNIFVLTARPAESAVAIHAFLKGLGLEIPLENITGLANGAPAAKAAWMVGKVSEGYNDFYFVDDHMGNVKAVKDVLNTFDVKGKVQQARVKHSMNLSNELNEMIERNKGIKKEATYSAVVAKKKGANKGKYKVFVPYGAEDFRGLTSYTLAGKGKQGEKDQAFFEENLMKPYMRGVANMEVAKRALKNDYIALLKMYPGMKKKLTETVEGTTYTYDQAIRVHLWTKQGQEIPDISKRDQNKLNKIISNDPDLSSFAEGLQVVSKKEQWVTPDEYWLVGSVLKDINDIGEKVNRAEYLAEFNENVDIIFSKENLNKLEAAYGTVYKEAIVDMIKRMKSGSNRPGQPGKYERKWLNWVNNSTGAIMFFNRKSALLQLLSTVNFTNWSDNNPIAQAAAFANQPLYWKTWAKIFNSPKLKERRGGLKSDVQEQEIANTAKTAQDKPAAILSYLLKIGFTPTQIADSFAIASGGAPFLINRTKTYKKQGLSQAEADARAWEDFSTLSEETQQSGDPAFISAQQASHLGRLILAFQNTPMQMTRLMKKAGQNLINGRGSKRANISKLMYYGFIQNLIFGALQNALFALLPDFDDEEDDEKRAAKESKKVEKIANSMVDSILRGSGLTGAVVSTIKNVIMRYYAEEEKGFTADHTNTLIELANVSPPIGSKFRKIYGAIQTKKFNRDVWETQGMSPTLYGNYNMNPKYQAIANVASGVLNLPLDRALIEIDGIAEALDARNTSYQRLALGLGYRTWEVNATKEEADLAETIGKRKRKEEGKKKAAETRRQKQKEKLEELAKMTPEEKAAYILNEKKKRSEAARRAAATRRQNKRVKDSILSLRN